MPSFSEWSTFYEVLGSASAALTGLQFVTIALLADIPMREPGEAEVGDAFATPTIVHFVSAFFLAVVGAVPWHQMIAPAVLWCGTGVIGCAYTLVVLRRIRAQQVYEPVLEDWACHTVLPLIAYAMLVVSAFLSSHRMQFTMMSVAFCAVLLLLIGVHNAWDNVTFLASRKRKQSGTS